jgi:hypothetical protein
VVSQQYLSLLPPPEQLASFPSYWTPEQWTGLRNSTLHHMHKTRSAQIQRSYEEAKEEGLVCGRSQSLADWTWASNMVASRSFGAGRATALVPLMDLLDHSTNVGQQPLGSTPGCIVVSDEPM